MSDRIYLFTGFSAYGAEGVAPPAYSAGQTSHSDLGLPISRHAAEALLSRPTRYPANTERRDSTKV